MEAWKENQLHEMKFVDCERAVFAKVARWAAELGFEFCSFGMRTPWPVTSPFTVAVSNYPEILQQTYELNHYVRIDPLVRHALSSVEMSTWTDQRFAGDPKVLQAARTAGVRSGVSQPTRGLHGVGGLLNLSGYERDIEPGEVEEKKIKIIWLANIAHQGLSRYLVSNFMPAAEVRLTEREVTVLRWVAEGKSSEEVAEILNLSERTVNFHINNANAKLGTPNRTAAAVHAALLGLL